MKYLEIKSTGEFPIEAITLIGASTKRGDESTIGMFGSGLKYAIAAIIRQKKELHIFSGSKEIIVDTKIVTLKGSKFNQIWVDGKPTSLTDSMGTEDWNGVFPFVREIYSNALDEDKNATIEIVNCISPTQGYTSFYIEATPDLCWLVENFDNYFTDNDKALFTSKDKGGIFNTGKGISIFRKGILAFNDENQKSVFNYNLESVEINESRVISNIYEVYNSVGVLLEQCTDKRILRRWINGISFSNAGKFEHSCILSDFSWKENNPSLVEVILEEKYYPVEVEEMYEDYEKKGRIALPLKLLKRFLVYAPDADILGITSKNSDLRFIIADPSMDLVDLVLDSLNFLNKTNYKTRLNAPIKYVRFIKPDTLGMAEDGVIYLSVKLDTAPMEEICKIIIEEQEHISTSYRDCTRSFQNHLFSLYFNQLKKSHNDKA